MNFNYIKENIIFEDGTVIIAGSGPGAIELLTYNVYKAIKIADNIEAGTIYINNYFNAAAQSPVGGYKQSGYGRENGWEGMRCFMQTKSVWLSTNPNQPSPF